MATKTVAAVTLKNDPMIARRDMAGAPRTRPCPNAPSAGALCSRPQCGVAIVHLKGKMAPAGIVGCGPAGRAGRAVACRLNALERDLAGCDDDNGFLTERKHR